MLDACPSLPGIDTTLPTSAGFVPYSGEGFALLLPSKYNPSKEKEFPGTTLRYSHQRMCSRLHLTCPSHRLFNALLVQSEQSLDALRSCGLHVQSFDCSDLGRCSARCERVACRYEDNGDAVNSIAVIVRSTTKQSIEEFGTPDKFLDENKNLLGAQVFKGETSTPCDAPVQ